MESGANKDGEVVPQIGEKAVMVFQNQVSVAEGTAVFFL